MLQRRNDFSGTSMTSPLYLEVSEGAEIKKFEARKLEDLSGSE